MEFKHVEKSLKQSDTVDSLFG